MEEHSVVQQLGGDRELPGLALDAQQSFPLGVHACVSEQAAGNDNKKERLVLFVLRTARLQDFVDEVWLKDDYWSVEEPDELALL